MPRTPTKQQLAIQVNDRILVQQDNGRIVDTTCKQAPWQLGDGTWVLSHHGRAGGYLLTRCHPLPDTLQLDLNAGVRAQQELQQLRDHPAPPPQAPPPPPPGHRLTVHTAGVLYVSHAPDDDPTQVEGVVLTGGLQPVRAVAGMLYHDVHVCPVLPC